MADEMTQFMWVMCERYGGLYIDQHRSVVTGKGRDISWPRSVMVGGRILYLVQLVGYHGEESNPFMARTGAVPHRGRTREGLRTFCST